MSEDCRHCRHKKEHHKMNTNGMEVCSKCSCGEFW